MRKYIRSHASFQQPHSGSIQHADDEPARALQPRQQRAHLVLGQHDRQARRAFRPYDAVEPRQVPLCDLLVKKEQGGEGLILGCRGNPVCNRQMSQKRLDLRTIHLLRVALAVEIDEALDPVDVRVFRAQAVLFVAQLVPDAIQHPRHKFWEMPLHTAR